jgi:single-stranded DNA-binding protein
LNFVAVSGYLADDPKPLGGDKGPVVMAVSVGQRKKDKESGEYKTFYKRFDCKVWGDLREATAGLSSGSKILLTGKLDVDEYMKDDVKVYKPVIVVDNLAEIEPPRASQQPEPDFDF